MPSAFCAGRSEKLKSTDSSLASCDTACHEGTTKMSRGPQVNDLSPTRLVPCPSTAQKIVASVARYGCPLKPFGRNWRYAPIVGSGGPPVFALRYSNLKPWRGSGAPLFVICTSLSRCGSYGYFIVDDSTGRTDGAPSSSPS